MLSQNPLRETQRRNLAATPHVGFLRVSGRRWAAARWIGPVDSGESGMRFVFPASRFLWDGAVVVQLDCGSGGPFCAVRVRERLWCLSAVGFLAEDSGKATYVPSLSTSKVDTLL